MLNPHHSLNDSVLWPGPLQVKSLSLAPWDTATTRLATKCFNVLSQREAKFLGSTSDVPTLLPCVLSANTEPLYFVKGLPVSTCRGGGEGKGVKVGGGSPWTLTASLVKKINKTGRKFFFFSFFSFFFFFCYLCTVTGDTWGTSEAGGGFRCSLTILEKQTSSIVESGPTISPPSPKKAIKHNYPTCFFLVSPRLCLSLPLHFSSPASSSTASRPTLLPVWCTYK